jgi:exopolysaccharide biosynthesis predicted pyruvyltransferase EpsI
MAVYLIRAEIDDLSEEHCRPIPRTEAIFEWDQDTMLMRHIEYEGTSYISTLKKVKDFITDRLHGTILEIEYNE